MRPIPPAMRAELDHLPRMHVCEVRLFCHGPCEGRIEWDHVWIYAGKQINEPWAIIGLCHKHHMEKEGNLLLKQSVQRASLRLATDEDLAKYPRKDWVQEKKALAML